MILLEKLTRRKWRVWVFSDVDGEYPLQDVHTFRHKFEAAETARLTRDLHGGKIQYRGKRRTSR